MSKGREEKLACGLDFGTTNSSICYSRPDGRPQVVSIRQLPDEQQLPYLPGYIYFAGGRRVYVGQFAKNYFHLKPHRVIRSVKRELDSMFRVGKNTYSGGSLARMIMRRLLAACREQSGRIVRECCLTVPSTFGSRERDTLRGALLKASRSLEKVLLLDEPLAAFIAHMSHADSPAGGPGAMNVMLIDMGGGTTDLAVLRVEGAGRSMQVTPLSVWSHVHFGGDDFDRFTAMDIALRRIEEGLISYDGLTESERKFLWGSYFTAAEKIKHNLADDGKDTQVSATSLPGEKPLDYSVNEAGYRQVTRPLLETLRESIRYVLERGGTNARACDRIVLTGGMSRFRIIQDEVAEFFGRDPELSPHPLRAVAEGACLRHASVLNPDRAGIETVKPVLTKALFLRLAGRRMVKVLPSCLRLPVKVRIEKKFATPLARSDALRIPFYQGNDDGSETHHLVTLTLRGKRILPPALSVAIDVEVDENKMIALNAGPLNAGPGLELRPGSSANVWGL